jgi:hypothetical protein
MKVLGRVLVTEQQQRKLAPGATLDIPRAQFRALVRAKAHIGDLLWVQEPYWEYLPKNRFTSQTVHGIVPCAAFERHERPKSAGNGPVRRKFRDGSRLPRVLSRYTLEIQAVLPDQSGIRCTAHLMQIDTFLHTMKWKVA